MAAIPPTCVGSPSKSSLPVANDSLIVPSLRATSPPADVAPQPEPGKQPCGSYFTFPVAYDWVIAPALDPTRPPAPGEDQVPKTSPAAYDWLSVAPFSLMPTSPPDQLGAFTYALLDERAIVP